MRNINFMELVFAGEYISVILILFVSTWKDGFLSIKKEIRTQTFLYRLIPVILCTVIGISVMAGSYFLPLEENRRYWLNLWIQFVMVVINYTILGASLFQRYGVYPRGRELATVIVAL